MIDAFMLTLIEEHQQILQEMGYDLDGIEDDEEAALEAYTFALELEAEGN